MRNQETTKYDYGHALLIAGAYGRMGCAILAARAALRSGCGLLTVHLPSLCVDAMQAAFPEAMVDVDVHGSTFTSLPPHLERYTAIAAGPGLGTDIKSERALLKLLSQRPSATPVVLDADAINILARNIQQAEIDLRNCILTPHAAEYQRLFGDADPIEMARRHQVIIVKKAHHTKVYAPDGQVYENHTGNAGMATAGSGDVLTGILLGMLCTNHLHTSVYDIVCRAVEIHGKLGDLVLGKQTESSLIASDLIEKLKDLSTDITTC